MSAAQDNPVPGLVEAAFQASGSLGKLDFVSDWDFSFVKEQHVSRETLFDMTIPGIMRYMENNEALSAPECILSGYYPPSVPFRCHLWSVHLFAAEHETSSLLCSKATASSSNLCVELGQVAPTSSARNLYFEKPKRGSSKQLGERPRS